MPLEEGVEDWCETNLQLAIDAVEERPVMRHTFSHFHLDITPCLAQVKNPAQSVMEADRRVWYKASQSDVQRPSLGLAAPVTILLNRINEELP